MGLQTVETTHVRVVCDACREVSAEVCGRREIAVIARASAVEKFRRAGWHHDAGTYTRSRSVEQAERAGSGRWYCRTCSSSKHL